MASCDGVRPLLSHVVEGELTPDEAMRVARHLSDCTACKIMLAREHRLAEMLERDLEDLPVGEEFVRSVMDTLPQGPPPRRRGRRGWRGLKLAGSLGFLGAGAMTVRISNETIHNRREACSSPPLRSASTCALRLARAESR